MVALAACTATESSAPEPASAEAPAAAPPLGAPASPGNLPLPQTGSAAEVPVTIGRTPGDVPAIYLSLETDPGRPVSVVFAIDAGGAPGPSDEPAIRLTPEGGRCNPQELSRYGFEGEAARPAFGPRDAARGVDPRRLPEFMAVAVSRRMIERGLAAAPEDTRPQNVCTRKLWERLVAGQTQQAAAATSGQ